MVLSEEYLTSIASRTGFRNETLEKVIRLGAEMTALTPDFTDEQYTLTQGRLTRDPGAPPFLLVPGMVGACRLYSANIKVVDGVFHRDWESHYDTINT